MGLATSYYFIMLLEVGGSLYAPASRCPSNAFVNFAILITNYSTFGQSNIVKPHFYFNEVIEFRWSKTVETTESNTENALLSYQSRLPKVVALQRSRELLTQSE